MVPASNVFVPVRVTLTRSSVADKVFVPPPETAAALASKPPDSDATQTFPVMFDIITDPLKALEALPIVIPYPVVNCVPPDEPALIA